MNYSPSDRMWQNILYANFILESVVSESAILTATIESLAIKGPLPVGEVGKILTEMSGMQQLSLHLKEKFGGLKKFLEKFPEIFVFSNDHPFNPHVLLRSCLGLEYQKMIYRGVIPMQIMVLFKKVSILCILPSISTLTFADDRHLAERRPKLWLAWLQALPQAWLEWAAWVDCPTWLPSPPCPCPLAQILLQLLLG